MCCARLCSLIAWVHRASLAGSDAGENTRTDTPSTEPQPLIEQDESTQDHDDPHSDTQVVIKRLRAIHWVSADLMICSHLHILRCAVLNNRSCS
jgi:hypothetical protein